MRFAKDVACQARQIERRSGVHRIATTLRRARLTASVSRSKYAALQRASFARVPKCLCVQCRTLASCRCCQACRTIQAPGPTAPIAAPGPGDPSCSTHYDCASVARGYARECRNPASARGRHRQTHGRPHALRHGRHASRPACVDIDGAAAQNGCAVHGEHSVTGLAPVRAIVAAPLAARRSRARDDVL